MPIELDPIDSSPSGYYATLADLYAVAGERNIIDYSDLSGAGTLDAERVQRAFDDADAAVNIALKRNGIAYPVASTAEFFELLTEGAARIATAWLYRARGNRDVPVEGQEGSEYYAKMGGWNKEANRLLGQYVGHRRQTLATDTNKQYAIG